MDFVSPTAGWVVGTDQNANIALYRTMDGGATWTLLFGNTAPAQQLPDLTANGIRIELQNPSCFTPGDPSGVRLNIVNNGQAAAGSFVVRVNNADQTVNGLGSGESITLFFSGSNSPMNNPVSVLVDATGLITESDENNNSISQMVPVPTPPLPCITPTFTPTPAPAALIGPYAVINVGLNDVLNIRSGAGSSQSVVGSFPYNATNVMRTGATASAEGGTWVEVQNPSGGTGWVNGSYLTEYVSQAAFCADTRIPGLIDQLNGSMNQSNGDMFASLVSPVHGVNVHLWAYAPAVNFSPSAAQTAFTSTQEYNWGSGGQSGKTDSGTFSQVIQPKMQDVLNAPNMETYCDNLTKVFPLSNPWPYTNIHYYNLYKPSFGQTFNFRTWLIGIEYINGQPYLYSMVTIPWEP
jgi:hypothetical protein